MTGKYRHTVDAKGRLFIPARLRAELGQTLHIAIGMDHCLTVYSDESWEAFLDKLRALPYSKAKAMRVLLANTTDCEPDGQGRVLLSADLRKYAGLEKEVVIVGGLDRAEIWNAARWDEAEAERLENSSLDELMEEMEL